MLWSFTRSEYAYLSVVQYIPHPGAPQLWWMKQMERVRFAMSETLIVASQSQDGTYNDSLEKMAPFVKIKPKKLFSVCILCLRLTNSMPHNSIHMLTHRLLCTILNLYVSMYLDTAFISFFDNEPNIICIFFLYTNHTLFARNGAWFLLYLDPKNCNALICLLHIVV
jgi:hypothetical protein